MKITKKPNSSWILMQKTYMFKNQTVSLAQKQIHPLIRNFKQKSNQLLIN